MTPLPDRIAGWFLPEEEPSLRARMFRAVSLVGCALSVLVVTPSNAFVGLPWFVHAATLAFGAICLGVHLAARRGRILAWPLFVAFMLLLDGFWFTNGGSDGPTALFFIAAVMYLVMFFEGTARRVWVALVLANGVGLILMEWWRPGWVARYPDAASRSVDLLLGFLIAVGLCTLFLWVVLDGNRREHARLQQATASARDSEALASAMFQLSPDPHYLMDAGSRQFLEINGAFADLCGFSREECLGRTSIDLNLWLDPADRARLNRAAGPDGSVRGFEARFRRRDGREIWVELSQSLHHLAGRPRLLGIARDITERRQAERDLRESEARYRAIFEQAGDYVLLLRLDPEGGPPVILDANESALRIHGYTHGELVGHPVTVIDPEVDTEENDRRVATTLDPGGGRFEARHRRKDGTLFDVEVRNTRLEVGDSTLILAVERDVTERKQADAERQRLESQVHHLQRMESVGRLAGGISHDMNNILAAIMAVAEMLRDQSGEHARRGELILEAARRGRGLLKGLLAFSRKDMEDAALLDLNEVTLGVADLLSNTTLQRVDLDLTLAPRLPHLMGSASALSTALMNLCVNAVDAMPEGGTLTLRTARLGAEAVELVVADTGQGMAPEVLSRAMEPFYTTKPVGKGTGLGLSMVYGTVQAHGGSLEMHSEPGRGTEVRITLPLAADGSVPGRPEPSAGPAAPEPGPGRRVLLVDDDPLVRQTAPELLASRGHQVGVASGGREALERLRKGEDWEVVLLDLNMPGLDGEETLHLIRSLRPDLPVIVASGHMEESVRERLEAMDRLALLPKPYALREFQEALAGLL